MPTNDLAPLPFDQMQALAQSIARSGMFGIRTPDQAMVLMSIAQAEGRHPALAARDYHVINGTPSKKAEAMLRDFLSAGGRVQWHELTDARVDATFTHPQGGEARISWDLARVQQAGLGGQAMHKKFPRQMLRSRVVSEGVRTVWPLATGGMYAPEEAAEIRAPIDVTPPAEPVDTAADLDAFAVGDAVAIATPIDEALLRKAAAASAQGGTESFRAFWAGLSTAERQPLRAGLSAYQAAAAAADDEAARDADPFGLPALPDEPVSEAPAVPLAAAARALVPLNGPDGEPDWQSWAYAFVGLIRQASPEDCGKLRISSLPQFGRCRTADGDAARAVLEALAERTKEPAA